MEVIRVQQEVEREEDADEGQKDCGQEENSSVEGRLAKRARSRGGRIDYAAMNVGRGGGGGRRGQGGGGEEPYEAIL